MLPVIKVKQFFKSDTALINEVRLLAAERNFPSLAKFDFAIDGSFWALLDENDNPTYFACAHYDIIDNKPYVRILSKSAQLSNRVLPLNNIPGKAKYAENYCLMKHHLAWASAHYPDIPAVVTAAIEYNKDSPKSHLMFKHCKSGSVYGVDTNYILTTVHKKTQGIFNIQPSKVLESYDQLEKLYKVIIV